MIQTHRIPLWLGIGTFLYVVLIAGLLQCVLLPYVFPSWHAGHGLLVMGDWNDYHTIATEMALRIRHFGWTEFGLRPPPREAVEAGLLGFLYVFLPNEPWILIPMNALVHAFSGVLLFQIAYSLTGNRMASLLGTLPFIFFPSSFIWTAQIHKDGICILAFFWFIRGWQLILNSLIQSASGYSKKGMFHLLLGSLVTWVMRPYLLTLYISFGWVILLLFTIHVVKKRIPLKRGIPLYLFQGLLFATSFRVPTIDRVYPEAEVKAYRKAIEEVATIHRAKKQAAQAPAVSAPVVPSDPVVPISPIEEVEGLKEMIPVPTNLSWYETPLLPKFIEVKLQGLSDVRNGFANDGHAGTNFDTDIRFKRAWDIFRYVPKAIVASVAAPFPRMWFGKSKYAASNTFFRKIVGMEMIFIYLCLPLLLGTLYLFRTRLDFQCMAGFAFFCMLIYALCVPNAAALHRFRYGFLMFLLSVSISAAPEMWRRLQNLGKLRNLRPSHA